MATSYVKTVLGTAGLVELWDLGVVEGNAPGLKNGLTATVKGAPGRAEPSLLPGGEGRSAKFSSGNFFEVAHNALLNLGDTWAIEGWAKLDSLASLEAQNFASKGNGSYYGRLFNEEGGYRLQALRSQFAVLAKSSSTVAKNTAIYFLMGKAGSERKVYLQAVDVTTLQTNSTCVNTSSPLVIGQTDAGFSGAFQGWLQYLALYSVLPPKATVEAHFAAGAVEAKKAKGGVTGTGTLSGKGKRTRKGKGGVSGAGSLAAKGKRTRKAKGGVSGKGTVSATAIIPERPNRLSVRERMPMDIHLLATSPSGKTYRWSDDGTGPDVIDELNDSGAVPGGNKDLTCTLARKVGVDYGDMKRGTRIELRGIGRMKLGEYRLERAPQVSGEHVSVAPAAAGYESHLLDDNTAQEIFIDADIGAWGEASAKRRVENPASKFDNAQVQVLPAGTPDPADLSSFSRVPAISHSWTEINNNGLANLDVAESWYFSDVELGSLMFDFAPVAGIAVGDTNWGDQVYASIDGIALQEQLAELNAAVASAQSLAVPPGRFALLLRDYYQMPAASTGKWEAQWKNMRVLGRHGLPVYGTWPAVGLIDSDVIAYVLQRWAPEIYFTTGQNGTIKPGRFIIPHLTFKEPTTAGEMIQQATRFELPEWGVWPGQFGPTFYKNPRGQREGAKCWRVRKHEVEFEDTGQQLDKVFNGVVVQGQATDRSTIFVGPTGCGLRYTSDRCLDRDPQNPVNEMGPNAKRYAKIVMKGIATMDGMMEAAEAFLEQCKLLDGSGKATLTGWVEDENGKEWPYYCVQEGHEIELHESSIPGPRYIVNSSRSRSSRSVSIDIDAPPDGFEAMMERLYAEYVGLALESGSS